MAHSGLVSFGRVSAQGKNGLRVVDHHVRRFTQQILRRPLRSSSRHLPPWTDGATMLESLFAGVLHTTVTRTIMFGSYFAAYRSATQALRHRADQLELEAEEPSASRGAKTMFDQFCDLASMNRFTRTLSGAAVGALPVAALARPLYMHQIRMPYVALFYITGVDFFVRFE